MTHYEVFRECFPELKLTEEHYDKLSEEKLCRAFELPEGFALVKENELRMLCVLPQKRGNGAGTRLFRFAEDYIRSRGYERMEIGGAGLRAADRRSGGYLRVLREDGLYPGRPRCGNVHR